MLRGVQRSPRSGVEADPGGVASALMETMEPMPEITLDADQARVLGCLIEKAISRLEEALDPAYWINGFILDEKEGKHAFDRLQRSGPRGAGLRGYYPVRDDPGGHDPGPERP